MQRPAMTVAASDIIADHGTSPLENDPRIVRDSAHASRRNGSPERMPLLRIIVAHPKLIPESNSMHRLLERDEPLSVFACRYSQKPSMFKQENGASAYGAERNTPAGEMMCRQAAMTGRADASVMSGTVLLSARAISQSRMTER